MKDRLLREVKEGNEPYFYNSWTWRKKRREVLDRDNHECQVCKRKGRVKTSNTEEALVVHHMLELKDFPELMLEDNNLLTCCFDCHNELHERFNHKETKEDRIGIPERW